MYVLPHILMLLNQFMSYNPHINWLMQCFFSFDNQQMDGPSQTDGHVQTWYNLLYNKTLKPSACQWPGECGRKKGEWEYVDHACSYYKLKNNKSLLWQMLGAQFEAWGREACFFWKRSWDGLTHAFISWALPEQASWAESSLPIGLRLQVGPGGGSVLYIEPEKTIILGGHRIPG